MRDTNASEELLLKYGESLLLAAYKHLTRTSNMEILDSGNDIKNAAIIDNLLSLLLNYYIFPEIPASPKKHSKYHCPYCEKEYKAIETLHKHIKEKHSCFKEVKSKDASEDYLQNYSRNALALVYLTKNFIDARRHADGDRIICLHKYLLLHFKADNRKKYSYQTLHLLAQVKVLLPPALQHELIWKRSVNNKGFPDTNIELDRELEHRNKYVKEDLRQYLVTEKSIDRCGKPYDSIKNILNNFDNEVAVTKQSGEHSKLDCPKDILELVDHFDNSSTFSCIPGRSHNAFPSFPKS